MGVIENQYVSTTQMSHFIPGTEILQSFILNCILYLSLSRVMLCQQISAALPGNWQVVSSMLKLVTTQ